MEWHLAQFERPRGGNVCVRLSDGQELPAWFIERKRVFVSPDGSIGYDPIAWRYYDAPVSASAEKGAGL